MIKEMNLERPMLYMHINLTSSISTDLAFDLSDDVREMTWEETKTYREEHPYEVLSKDDKFDYGSRKIRIKKTI